MCWRKLFICQAACVNYKHVAKVFPECACRKKCRHLSREPLPILESGREIDSWIVFRQKPALRCYVVLYKVNRFVHRLLLFVLSDLLPAYVFAGHASMRTCPHTYLRLALVSHGKA